MDKYRNSIKNNNTGVSLVELLIVIAILGVLAGGSALGISLAFSKDAASCASKLNDALSKARMYSMSNVGSYSFVIKNDGGSDNRYVAYIYNGTDIVETIFLDEQSGGKRIISITPELASDGTVPAVSIPLVIKFNKSKGCVDEIDSTDLSSVNAVLKFSIEAARGSGSRKYAEVNLVTSTGKHFVGNFQ